MDAELSLEDFYTGFLSNFLSKGLKTNQLEVNTDEKTHKPIARLKEPRDLYALPKDKDNDCSQQAARWPTECQVLEERVVHIAYSPLLPELYNQPSGLELKPRPVGEENGVVVYNYNPVSAVNYKQQKPNGADESDGSDSDTSSSESRSPSPERCKHGAKKHPFSKMFSNMRSSSNSNDDDDDDEDDDLTEIKNMLKPNFLKLFQKDDEDDDGDDIEDIWGTPSPYYSASPTKCSIQRIEAKPVPQPVALPTPQTAQLEIVNNNNNDYCNCSFSSSSNITLQHCKINCYAQNLNAPSSSTPVVLVHQLNVLSTSQPLASQSPKSPSLPLPHLDASFTCLNSYDLANIKFINILKDKNNDLCCPLTQFSRSSVGGSKFLTQVHPFNANEYNGLWFESRFESGNLAKAVKITETYYELYLRPDLYTSRSKQWFYFRVERTKKNVTYRFSIVNLVKSDSLYNEGMRPLMYSTINARKMAQGWRRCGQNICYYRNDEEHSNEDEEDNSSYTLTFNVEFPNDNDTVYFAHSYPYTYSDLQDYLMAIQKHPVKSKFCKLRLLCRSLAGNNVYYLTVTAPTPDDEFMKKKKAIVISARVHPSETPSSWMMKGLMDFITGDSSVAKRLRHKFIFKLIPMLNPDGVIVGNTRNSLTGKDLNRQYRTVIRETYPSIWYTKAMIKRLIDECGVAMYCDMHAHSRMQNIFLYGCENRRNPEKKLTEQVFPLMLHKNVADKFSFENCKFRIQKSKEGTGRIVVWMLGVTNSYTLEASFGGTNLGSRRGTHFSTDDYEHIGRAFCETLYDYCDENPNKERLRLKIIERLIKEGSNADEPLNIPLSDYSSDEGNSSSSSDNEGKADRSSALEGPCCAPLKAPPCTPEFSAQQRKARKKKHRSKSSSMTLRNQKRIPIDMPTTDPGSDLVFSTDEESDGGMASNYMMVPRPRRYFLQSDLQRRYMDQSNQTSPITSRRKMPPELIVTPATNRRSSTTNSSRISRTLEKPKKNSLLTAHSPDPAALKRRTNSWHSLNRSGMYITKRIQNSVLQSEEYYILKKKIWNGFEQDGCNFGGTTTRLNGWERASTNESQTEYNEQKAFLAACTEKLTAWKQQTADFCSGKKFRDLLDDKHQFSQKAKESSTTKLDAEPKLRKKKSSNIIKTATETTKTINNLNKINSNFSMWPRRTPQNLAVSSSSTLAPLEPSTSKNFVPKKFKTGGIVATAVQPIKKLKRQRPLMSLNKPLEIPSVKSATLPREVENEKSFARKSKTKLKKKRSVSSLRGQKS